MICHQKDCGQRAAWTYVWPSHAGRLGCCVLHKAVVDDIAKALGVFIDMWIEDWHLLEIWEDAMVHDAIDRLRRSAYFSELKVLIAPAIERQQKQMLEIWKANGWDIKRDP